MKEEKKEILIVEDEPLIAEDLSLMLQQEGYNICSIAYDGSQALDAIRAYSPFLILLDISLSPAMTGIDVAKILHQQYHIPFIFITALSDKTTLSYAKQYLPQAYIVKPFKKRDLLTTLEIVIHRLETWSAARPLSEINQNLSNPLTEMEYKTLSLVAKGKTNKEIAASLYISENTVKTHLKHLFKKLNVSNRTETAGFYFR